jgi:uncharacterized membrane protein YciS (DUF1049 family)
MRTGNPIDGMYILLLVIPFLLSLWGGDILRKKIVTHLALQSSCNHNISSFLGILAETIILIAGVLTGLLFIRIF